jgi:hypothetical protein
LDRTISAPIKASSSVETAFTVALVPTGMKAGVLTGPLFKPRTPVRAFLSLEVRVNSMVYGRHLPSF